MRVIQNGQTLAPEAPPLRPARSAPVVEPFSLSGLFALGSALFLIFVLFSRTFDMVGARLHIPMVAYGLALLGLLWTGGFVQAITSKVGLLWIGFTVWMALCIPTSVWRGGSFDLVFRTWSKALVVFFIFAGLSLTLDQGIRLIRATGWSVAVLALLALKFGNTSTGRLFLDQGKLANPNDMAQMFLVGLCCLWMVVRSERLITFKRVAAVTSMFVVSYAFLRTGSRGGMIAFAVVALLIMMDASGRAKVFVPLICILMALVLTVAMPDSLKQRYLTFTVEDLDEESVENEMNVTAVASTESRLRILKESIRLTIMNPILGVGPGMFPDATYRNAKAEGKHITWLETHNSYTQVSSESGFPGFLLFASVQWVCLRRIREMIKKFRGGRDERSRKLVVAGQTLLYMLTAYAVTSFFASVAYQSLFPFVSGLIVAITVIGSRIAPPEATPAPVRSVTGTVRLRPALPHLRP